MKKYLALAVIILFTACNTQEYKPVKIAMISGETLNTRLDLSDPSPYEKKVAYQSLEKELKPLVNYYSRTRAEELFKSGEVDIVVSGQASVFSPDLKDHFRIVGDSKAVLFYNSANHELCSMPELPKGTKLGFIRSSAHAKEFIKRAGELQLTFFNSSRKAAEALNRQAIDCLIIDEIAVSHFEGLLMNFKMRPLDLPKEPVIWLYR